MIGSDLVAETLRRLGIDYVALNPGASLRGIHESLLNHPGTPPAVLTLHENVAVGVAHGYAKAAGRPMAVGLHDTVGLLNGSMALFNAWADRAPMLVLVGTGPLDAEQRRPWIDWLHTAGEQGELVRRFSVWDDQPASLPALVTSLWRGLSAACGPVGGPAIIGTDVQLQEAEAPPFAAATFLAHNVRAGIDPAAIDSAAKLIRSHQRPLLVADRPLNPAAARELVGLAELTGAGMYEAGGGGNVPVGHPFDLTDHPALAASADLVVTVDVRDVGLMRRLVGLDENVPAIDVGVTPLRDQSWMPLSAPVEPGLQVAGEPEIALAALRAVLADAKGPIWGPPGGQVISVAPTSAADLTPAVLAAATASATQGEDVVIAHGALDGWVRRAFRLQRPDQFLGRSGGEGLGYALPATLGAALAYRRSGRFIIGFQTDGDMLYVPQALWTASHEHLPALMVVVNNRGYQRDAYHQRLTAVARQRDAAAAVAGVALEGPDIEIAALARAFGVRATGPVTSLGRLRAALREGVEAVRSGDPYLVEVESPRVSATS